VRNLYNSFFLGNIMRKRTGGIIFIIFVIAFIGSYYTVPKFKMFVDANTALVTSLGVLIGVFLWWYSNQSEKKTQEETLEKKITTILSPISGLCLGRDTELSQLENDLKHKNVLLIKGIAGIGKTTLGLKFRDRLKEKGYQTFWHQFDSQSYESLLLNLSEYLEARGSLSAVHLKDQEKKPGERLKIAVQELCHYPTVVFLDNFQVFEDDSDFKIFTDYLRNSHLVIMSRSQPEFLSEDYENLEYLDRDSSVELLRTLKVKESQEVLEKIYEKTRGHPWSLMCFKELSRVLPVRNLLEELPDFSKEQQTYISEQCWEHLGKSERDFLMRASVFTKPLNFDALRVCSKAGLSEILISLAESFYLMKRGDSYHIHDIIKDFAFLKLREDQELYVEAQKEAADYYQERLSAENLLLIYHHLREAGDHREAVNSIVHNIVYFWREGFWSDVRGVLEESLDFSKDEKVIAGIYYDLGTIVRRLGEWDRAIEYYAKNLEISEKLGDVHVMASTYNNLGVIYDSKGEWDRAIEYYEKSLEIFEKLEEIHGIAGTCNNLGLVYYRKGEWDRAIEYYEKSLEVSEKLGDVHVMAPTYRNLGGIYRSKGEWDRAIEYYEKDLEVSEKLGDVHSMALARYGIANILSDKKEFDDALKLYFKSEKVLKNLGDKFNLMNVYHNLALCHEDMNQEEKAKEYRQKSEELRKQLGIENP